MFFVCFPWILIDTQRHGPWLCQAGHRCGLQALWRRIGLFQWARSGSSHQREDCRWNSKKRGHLLLWKGLFEGTFWRGLHLTVYVFIYLNVLLFVHASSGILSTHQSWWDQPSRGRWRLWSWTMWICISWSFPWPLRLSHTPRTADYFLTSFPLILGFMFIQDSAW